MTLISPLFDHDGHLVKNQDIRNYFDIYGFPDQELDLDESKITDRYLELSRRIHPDLFQSASNNERELSVYYSELLNNGYKTLKNPFKRARYYLEINNALTKGTEIPTEVAADVFEIQEILENERLTEADVTELNQYVEQFGQLQRSYKNRLEDLFKQANQMDKDDLRRELNQLISANAYIERIFTNIEAKLEIYENE